MTAHSELKKSLREEVLSLRDELNNGVRYDEKLNLFVLCWTKRQVANARRRGSRLWKKFQSLSAPKGE